MKKLFVIILALVLVLTLAAGCGNNDAGEVNDANGAGVEEEAFRSSGVSSQGLELSAEGLTLEDINSFDTEGSFRAGASWADKDLTAVK